MLSISDVKSKEGRKVVWFSCGAASAVAAKLAVQEYGDDCVVVYCDTGGEHESNKQFLKDVQSWIGKDITVLKNEKYKDHFDVYEKTKYLLGAGGARCTIELKKKLRFQFQRADDVHLFGYTLEERERARKFESRNPELYTDWILIRKRITKADCLGIIWKEGITLPVLYEQGMPHNNCIPCVRGGQGYFNKIRVLYPAQFNRMAEVERKIGHSIFRHRGGPNKGEPVYLDELSPTAGRFDEEPPISCGLGCSGVVEEINEE